MSEDEKPKLVDVAFEDYTFGDGSMNARQYHAWLWAQIPGGLSEAKLRHMSAVINRMTLQFMSEAMLDDVETKNTEGGLAAWLRGQTN